jgi:SAM-dependent methyltransferase
LNDDPPAGTFKPKAMKDHFSANADGYARFRPTYPPSFYEYLQRLLPPVDHAWDCGTGNGQVAAALANFVGMVHATDISPAQLRQAPALPNVQYSEQAAEQTQFSDDFFGLITVGQAVHWFQFERFYAEVVRTAKPGAILAVMGYGRLQVTDAVDAVIAHLYKDIVGPYWDPERRYIEEGYQTIPFPFEELAVPHFSNTHRFSLNQLLGYLGTWSAVQHYAKAQGHHPIALVQDALAIAWGKAIERQVQFPMLLRLGRVSK